MNELDLFIAANAIADLAERAAYLERVCADQPELRRRLEALLAGNAQSQHPLDLPPSHPPAADDPTHTFGNPAATGTYRPAPSAEESEGAVIAGRYKLRQRIGEGGMGTVWMADQTAPVKRRVAVKLIRTERGASKTILSRFEAERQAIALMDHPHIAKLLDAGTTETGAPFFVMELVKGIPLTEFCDAHRLSVPERLSLFMQVCGAVQHAHQKGIIHRDLKPSNILVESHDGRPVPKVIDFGLAKATTGLQLTEHTLFTGFGSVLGTPLYMAPEQAAFNAVDVDTRADVYALGVVLYELLTGTTPLTREAIKQAALDELLRLVREQEPPTPSSRLSSPESKPAVAANRQTEPAKLGRLVKGELDWIVLKALSKDRDRRYDTANGLAKDIDRFLNHEPVSAGPPTAGYRLRKFARRNRGPVTAAALVLAALLLGMAGTTFGLVEARRQEAIAVAAQRAEADRAEGERLAKDDALRAAAAERAASEQARKRLGQIEKANDLLGSIFENLDPSEVAKAGRPLQAVLVEKLDRAVEQLEGDAIGDPLVVAQLQHKLGVSLTGLGEPGKAVGLFTKARATLESLLGADNAITIKCVNDLAVAYFETGDRGRALPLFERTLRQQRENLGPDHPDTLEGMNNLASGYQAVGKFDLALPLFKEALERRRERLGHDHGGTLESAHNLAAAYSAAGKHDLALPLFEGTLAAARAKFGPGHPDTLRSINGLGFGYMHAGQPARAVPHFEEAFRLRLETLGPLHRATLVSSSNLAIAYEEVGEPERALPLHESAYRVQRESRGEEHAEAVAARRRLTQCYALMHRPDASVRLLEEALRRLERKHGRQHGDTLQAVADLGAAYLDADRPSDAVPLLEEAYRARKQHPALRRVSNELLTGYARAGKTAQAVALARELAADARAQTPAGSPQRAVALAGIGDALYQANAFADAEPLLRECLGICERGRPDAWPTFDMQSLLGGTLLGQQKYADAEPLLRKGYDGLKAREGGIPPQSARRIPEALDRLIALYTATNRPAEAAKYRQLRAAYRETLPPPRREK